MRRTATALRSHRFRHHLDLVSRLEDRTAPAILTFQQGVEGATDLQDGNGPQLNGFVYAGTQDAELQTKNAASNFGSNTSISIDTQDGSGLRQGLLRFDDVFGGGKSQVPFGSTITKATLTFRVTSSTDVNSELGLHRMRKPWQQDAATANSFLPIPGVQTDGIEAEAFRDWNLPDDKTSNNIFADADVTQSFLAWSTGTPNYGWLVDQTAVNGWDFATGEASNVANRPRLSIEYTAPAGPGGLRFAQSAYDLSEPDTGSKTYSLLVTRSGGVAGSVTVNYAIAPNNATAGVDFDNTALTGSLTFAANETNRPLNITLLGDTAIEGPESFKITLSNPSNLATLLAPETTINIVDNDLLVNEVLANFTGADESGYEYVEIAGAPSAVIPAGTYFVAFNSATELAGGTGTADVVVPLGGKTIGTNGLLSITPTNFKFALAGGSSQVIATQLDAVGGGLSDRPATYAIVYSPDEAIAQGADFDTSTGSYVNDATPFGNDGILDVAPFVPQIGKATAILLDAIGTVEGPNNQADRPVAAVRPGPRVTIPDDFDTGATRRFTPDALSRVFGDRQANSSGAYYAGELSGITLVYSTGLFSSGRTPPGGQVTPGDLNIPRGISFEVTSVSVSESAGAVTLLVNRSGDSSIATSVDFATADSSAKAGVAGDYLAVSGKLDFPIGVNQQPIVIALNNESVPEGFEAFTVNLSNSGAPFVLVTSKAVVTITDDDSLVATFQDGDLLGEYTGTRDVGLYGWLANDKLGSDFSMAIDRNDDDPTLSTDIEKPNQGLLRFDDLFGAGAGQVPVGSTIFGGFITLNVTDITGTATNISAHRMLSDWIESTATFNNPAPGFTNGITYDDVEARATPDGILGTPTTEGFVELFLTADTLQAWANQTASNFGWTIQSDSGNGWNFDTSDQILGAGPNVRPKLTLIYTPPGGAGTVRFAEPTVAVNEDAGTANLTVQRIGATTGSQTINWAITGGTATAADFTGPTSGSFVFGPGDLSANIGIPIVNDGSLETNETIQITLTGAGVTFTRDVATLVIRDNDFNLLNPAVLLNEVHINPSGNDHPYEYAEIAGTAGAALGNLYVVSLRGEADVFAGSADIVADLSTFVNGGNGFTVVRGSQGYALPAGATAVNLADFNLLDNFQNGSNSFALIYSPQATIAQGYDFDWGNTGTLSLPVGAVVVDSVGFQASASNGKIYGPELVQSYTPEALSRTFGNSTANSTDWFRGTVSSPNDSLAYSNTNNTNLPVTGAALTPGGPNTSAATPLTTVASVAIDTNTAQRSLVRSITVTFTNPVQNIAAGAFTLTDQANNLLPGVTLNVAGEGTGTVTLTFSGTPIIGGSLADGRYRLKINGEKLAAGGRLVDAKNDANPGSNLLTDFHRLFGDSDGDTDVDIVDFVAFRLAFGTGPSIFDADGDGDTDNADFVAFRGHFGVTLP